MRIAYGFVAVGGLGVCLMCGPLISQRGPQSAYADEASAGRDSGPAPAESARLFDARIAPLLVRHCLECHGPTSKKGRLDLSRKATALAGGSNGKAILPGKADDSLLLDYVESGEMPPKNRPPLSEQEKQVLRKWIDDGAVWSTEAIGSAALADQRIEPHREFEWTDDVRDPGPVLLRRLTVAEYIETVRSAAGVDVGRDARRILPPDVRADGFSNTAYNLTIDLGNVEAYAELAEIIVRRMDVAAFATEFSRSQQLTEANLRETVSSMGKWLLRGPLQEHELAAFVSVATAVAEDGGDFTEAVSYVIEAMLQSPRFLYLIEDQRGDGSVRRVGDHELASRLSYILWGGPPDKELMRAADAGQLSDRSRVEAQVRRMLEDPRAVERSARFVHEWLNLDQLSSLRPNQVHFPNWNDQLAADMREETLAFFRHIAWEQKRPLSDLMNAQVTFATPRLAAHYGLDGKHAVADSAPAEPALPRRGDFSPRENLARVTDGLLTLYTFEEGGGDTVRDVSRIGEPLDLKIENASAVAWSDKGLTVNSSTLIATAGPPRRLIDAVKKSNAVTLEAWVTPADTRQDGPARILSLSSGSSRRNFTLGQEGNKYDVRFRTTKGGDSNGLPSLNSPGGSLETRQTHVVYVRDAAGKATLYIDGQERGIRDVGGDLSNWDNGFRLLLANETSKDRPWRGTLHLVAVFGRALSADEVRRNHAAGPRQSGPPALARRGDLSPHDTSRVADDLQALYRFDQGGGDTVRDLSNVGEPLNLKVENPSAVAWTDQGLKVNASTLIATTAPPKRLIDAVKKSNAVTLEAWITPGDTRQSGPARILTLSSGISQRNFTLGQEGNKYDVRLRTTRRDINGMPGLSSSSGSVATALTHVVSTRTASGTGAIYVNGQEQIGRDVIGDLSNWDDSFRLALANETSNDRPWRGTYHLVAVYSRALSADEVRQNHAAGTREEGLLRYDLASVPGRGGLLTQGSVLTVGGDEASMVTRGLFVLSDVLSSMVGDPPPCVDTSPVPTKPAVSQRAIAEARLANSACSGCHARFEPLAFGLEKFDGIGAWHEKDEHGNTLREDGEILFPGQDKAVSYKTSAELMDLLADSERVRQTLTLKVTQFALGRPLVKTDARLLADIHQAAWEGKGTYAGLITAIVMSDLVQMTRTEPAP